MGSKFTIWGDDQYVWQNFQTHAFWRRLHNTWSSFGSCINLCPSHKLDQTVMSLDFALKGTGKNAGTGTGNEKYVLTDKGTQIEEEGSY